MSLKTGYSWDYKNYHTYKVYWPDDGETEDDAVTIESSWASDNLEYVAEDAGEYNYTSRGGWEDRNDVQKIAVLNPETNKYEIFEVEREYRPHFNAFRVDD